MSFNITLDSYLWMWFSFFKNDSAPLMGIIYWLNFGLEHKHIEQMAYFVDLLKKVNGSWCYLHMSLIYFIGFYDIELSI